jgi:hypothetical protein
MSSVIVAGITRILVWSRWTAEGDDERGRAIAVVAHTQREMPNAAARRQ